MISLSLPPPQTQADLSRGDARQKEINSYQQNASRSENRVASMTQDFKTKQNEASSKGRRHGRSLATVHTKLEATHMNQKLSRMAQAEVEAEQKGREVMERMEVGVREGGKWGGGMWV